MRQSPEILAPAGSMEALTAAVHCGADAVYIGATLFSARQNAHNFDAAALREAADFCHTNGVKLYLTVNTLVFDTEWAALDELLQTAAAIGIDACIVQDLGVADYIHQRIPEMPLHASTQMTICSPSGAIWAKEHGFSRVVVAREMTRSEIQAVCAIGLEVEQFVHGALCMCISGQCYLSALIGARSANRGCCAQACRLPFTAAKNPQAAALSLKDLCLLPHYQQLCADGIASLKIEGRMKRPEYVAAAVTALRQLKEGKQPDLQMLRAVFSRSGFTDGYYTGQRKQMFGVRQKEDVTAANAVLPKLAELAKKPAVRLPLTMAATVILEQPVSLTATLPDGTSVTVQDAPPELAKNKPCDAAFLERQLGKLGNTAYQLDSLTATCDGKATVSAATLNALRRTAIEQLQATRKAANTPQYTLAEVPLHLPKQPHSAPKKPNYWVQVQTMEQLHAVQSSNFPTDKLLLPLYLAEQLSQPIPNAILTLPTFAPDETTLRKRLQACQAAGWNAILCDTIAHLVLGKQLGLELHGGTGLNLTNRHSVDVIQQYGVSDTLLSVELTIRQALSCCDRLPAGIFAYGHLPVMKTRLCPIREEVGCRSCKHQLKDRTDRTFPVFCTEGYTVIYNAVPVWVADRFQQLQGFSTLLLSFSIESPKQIQAILADYQAPCASAPAAYTRGLLLRGLPSAVGK